MRNRSLRISLSIIYFIMMGLFFLPLARSVFRQFGAGMIRAAVVDPPGVAVTRVHVVVDGRLASVGEQNAAVADNH